MLHENIWAIDPLTGQRFEIPGGGAELLKDFPRHAATWGRDMFCAIGRIDRPQATLAQGRSLADGTYVDGVTVNVMLAEGLAINPQQLTPQACEAHPERRALLAFLKDPERGPENQRRFPTFSDVRTQNDYGKGLCLLGGGGVLFVDARIGKTSAGVKLALMRRTGGGKVGYLTFGSGLFTHEDTPVSEFVEETTLCSWNPQTPDRARIYLPLPHGLPAARRAELIALKKKQAPVLLASINRLGLRGEAPDFTAAQLDFIAIPAQNMGAAALGLPSGTISVYGKGQLLFRLNGHTGFEHDVNTLGVLDYYRLRLDLPKGSVLHVIDGEFDRPGLLAEPLGLKQEKMITPLAGLAEHMACRPHSLPVPERRRTFYGRRRPAPAAEAV